MAGEYVSNNSIVPCLTGIGKLFYLLHFELNLRSSRGRRQKRLSEGSCHVEKLMSSYHVSRVY